ncbi:MAG: hypothetical protein K1V99_09590 [Bacteroidales bacterium]|nr:hypothetical protein [Bacteroidales bacterium]
MQHSTSANRHNYQTIKNKTSMLSGILMDKVAKSDQLSTHSSDFMDRTAACRNA